MFEALTAAFAEAATWELVVFFMTAAVLVSSFLEKMFDVKFFGRYILGAIWKLVKFLANWAVMPFKPQLQALTEIVNNGAEIEGKFITFLEKYTEGQTADEEREAKRDEQFKTVFDGIDSIKKEVTTNGGGSIKDIVKRLERHDSEKWNILMDLRRTMHLFDLRLNIMDETDQRMSFRLSAGMECTMVSANFLRFFGYTEKDILGSDWDFMIADQSKADVAAKWQRAVAKKTKYRNEQHLMHSDGKSYHCIVTGYPIHESNGDFEGFYGTVEVIEKNA